MSAVSHDLNCDIHSLLTSDAASISILSGSSPDVPGCKFYMLCSKAFASHLQVRASQEAMLGLDRRWEDETADAAQRPVNVAGNDTALMLTLCMPQTRAAQ